MLTTVSNFPTQFFSRGGPNSLLVLEIFWWLAQILNLVPLAGNFLVGVHGQSDYDRNSFFFRSESSLPIARILIGITKKSRKE